MSNNKMLIDATHPEETRVVVVRDKRVEDFDFEAASRKPLRGNIYLAKVTRVEPSLQAAFVEYGGNRHGFLAFSEIHPDYYQIPQADRAALLEEERSREDDGEEAPPEKSRRRRRSRSDRKAQASSDETPGENEAGGAEPGTDDGDGGPEGTTAKGGSEDAAEGSDGEEDRRAQSRPAQVASATDEDVVASDVAATATEREAEIAASASDDEPAALGRAAEQVEETVDASVEAAEVMPRGETEAAPAPQPEAEPSGAPATADAPGDDATAEESDGASEEKPAPRRRRRTKKSDDGLADPQVSEDADARSAKRGDDDEDDGDNDRNGEDDGGSITAFGNSDALEEIPERRRAGPRRQYKIQEVIKRRQIILVQVVKEERGTKGAALTTYLSLAGRYCVLMPNTDRGGGVSRKITDASDRKRLKSVVAELDVPEGMGVILRTAGAARTKTEIKRDFEYLLRLWENVRELTLKSIAPQLVYEEGNLVKRAIRDLYSKEIDEVLVAGESAYREAKDFMRMLMPSHARNVKPYREPTPIFTAYQVEAQLDAMFSPQVTLPSKGYIVINPTEALVAIDVNSGKSTKESNIEDTALKTNLEAADEVARQLRLRDLAGLIVIDFIDMDEKRHNRQVEKRLKDALKLDRSRIQVGRISPFGLMEMSRQRIRQGMVETSMVSCPACAGTGQVRSTQSVALHCLRTLEEHLLKHSDHHVTIKTSSAVALYILNQKRSHLNDLEERFGLEIGVDADENLSGQHMEIVKGGLVERAPGDAAPTARISPDAVSTEEDENEEPVAAEPENEEDAGQADGERGSRRRRRRRRRGGSSGEQETEGSSAERSAAGDDETSDGGEVEAVSAEADRETAGDETESERRSRRRRGRRGGRRHRREGEVSGTAGGDDDEDRTETEGTSGDAAPAEAAPATEEEPSASGDIPAGSEPPMEDVAGQTEAQETPGRVVTVPIEEGRAAAAEAEEAAAAAALAASTTEGDQQPASGDDGAANEAGTEAGDAGRQEPADAATASAGDGGVAEPDPAKEEENARKEAPERKGPRRVGWWQRRSFF